MAVTTTRVQELRGQLASGAADFAALWDVPRDDLAWLERLGAALFTAARFDDARLVFEALMALEPRRARHALHAACAFERLERVDDAQAALERALTDDADAVPLTDDERAAALDVLARVHSLDGGGT